MHKKVSNHLSWSRRSGGSILAAVAASSSVSRISGDVSVIRTDNLGRKFMSCSHVKIWVNLLTRLLIGCSLLCSQSGASLLVDTTLDNDYNL